MKPRAENSRECQVEPLGEADVCLVVGKRGTGKSTFAKRLADVEIAAGRRVLSFDFHDEASVAGRASPSVELGRLAKRVTVDQLVDEPSLLDDEALSLAVVPDEREPAGVAEALREVSGLALRTGDLTLFIDELGVVYEHAAGDLNYLATQSRHWNVPVVFVGQRTIQLPKTARTQVSRLYSFRQTNKDDLKELEELTESEQFAHAVKRLPRGHLLSWRDAGN